MPYRKPIAYAIYNELAADTTLTRLQTFTRAARCVSRWWWFPEKITSANCPNVHMLEFCKTLYSLNQYITDVNEAFWNTVVGFLEYVLVTAKRGTASIKVIDRLGAGSFSTAYLIQRGLGKEVFKVTHRSKGMWMTEKTLRHVIKASDSDKHPLPITPITVSSLDASRINSLYKPIWYVTQELHELTPSDLRGDRKLKRNLINCIVQCIKSAEYHGKYAMFDLKLDNFMYNFGTDEVFLTDLDMCDYEPLSTEIRNQSRVSYDPYFSFPGITQRQFLRGIAMLVIRNVHAMYRGDTPYELWERKYHRPFHVDAPSKGKSFYTWATRMADGDSSLAP